MSVWDEFLSTGQGDPRGTKGKKPSNHRKRAAPPHGSDGSDSENDDFLDGRDHDTLFTKQMQRLLDEGGILKEIAEQLQQVLADLDNDINFYRRITQLSQKAFLFQSDVPEPTPLNADQEE